MHTHEEKVDTQEVTTETTTKAVEAACRNTNIKARNWELTWNNYTESEFEELHKWCAKNCTKFTLGREGKDKTPHIQGHLYFKSDRAWSSLCKAWPKCHWEKTRNVFAAAKYCEKEGNAVKESPMKIKLDAYMEKVWSNRKFFTWQEEIFEILKTEPDERTINWFWEPDGGAGKSQFAKYLIWKFKAVIVNGKQNDIFNGIKTYLEEKQDYMDVVIVDVPRVNSEYICYSSMEKIKDGLFYSGKYEGGQILLIPCHLIVFANVPPDTSKMSMDRWNIRRIE